MRLPLLFLALAAPAPATPDPLDEIVVTRRRGSAVPRPEPFAHFRDRCFEATRRTGHPAPPPVDDRDWAPLDDATRRQLRLDDPATAAFDLFDDARGQRLILKIEQPRRTDGLAEISCSLIVLGGSGHDALPGRMSGLFGAPGSERHVGHQAGIARVAGWRQWAWTGMPGRRSHNWRSYAPSGPGSRRGSFLVVIDPEFYDSWDYIVGELKTRQGADHPISVLTFSHTHRPEPRRSSRASGRR